MLPIIVLVMMSTSAGQTFGVSAFYPAWIDNLGLSRGQIGTVYGLATLAASVPMAFVGAAMDRWGARALLSIVILFFGGTCIGISFAGSLAGLGLGFFFLRLLGQGSMGLIASNTLAHWFDRRLGRVAGFTSLAMPGAIAFIPAMNLFFIAANGWRWTYRAWGFFLLAVLLPIVAAAFRSRPEDMGQRPDGLRGHGSRHEEPPLEVPGLSLGQAARKSAYWIALSCTVYWALTVTAIMLVLVDHYADKGLSAAHAAAAFSITAAAMAGSQILGGFLADFAPLNRLLSISAGSLGLAALALALMKVPFHGWAAMIILGFAQGIGSAVNATLWVRYFGRRHLGKIRGTLTTAMVAGSSLGPLLVGWGRDLYLSYDPVFWGLGLLGLPLAAIALRATKPQH